MPRAPDRRRSPSFVVVLTASLAFVLLGTAVQDGPTALDVLLAQIISPLARTPLGYALELLNWIGQAVLWLAVVLLIAAAFAMRRSWRVALALLAGLGSEVLVAIAKTGFDRARPLPPLGESIASIDLGSYPSGHVTRMGVTLGILLLFAVPAPGRLLATVLIAAAIVFVALARIAFLEHWATDTLGGLLLAAAWVSAVHLLSGPRSLPTTTAR